MMFKRYLIAIIFLVGLSYFIVGVDFASAAATDNVSGWAWSSNIGWISFNGDNPEVPTGADYGVHICESDTDTHLGCGGAGTEGKLVGYAWSENIGWIMFNPPSPYLAVGPNYSVKLDTATNQITGWARACAGSPNGDCTGGVGAGANAGGWDGWIKLGGSTYPTNIDFSTSPAEFHNYAWGSDVVGWISFNCAEGGVAGGNICGKSDYKVTTTYSSKPKASNLSVSQYDECNPPAKYQFSWTFSGLGTFDHSRIQIDDKPTFADCPGSGCEIDIDILSTSKSISLAVSAVKDLSLAYKKAYYWQVKVWDSDGRSSDWTIYDPDGNGAANSFTTLDHMYPNIAYTGFTWSPGKPALGEEVQFINNSDCFDTNNNPIECNWSWVIPDSNYVQSTNSGSRNPIVEFLALASKLIQITATDPNPAYSSYFCTDDRSLEVNVPLPEWREITPR